MQSNETVSVIIPAYNRQQYVAEAIQSALQQTRRPFEVIVVDDGSTDGTRSAVQKIPSVRYELQPHSGAGVARSRGAGIARGEFLAFLDSDDMWPPSKLAKQLEAFQTQPDLKMVFGQVRQLHDGPEWSLGIADASSDPSQLMPGYVPGTMMVRRAAFFHVGLFNTQWRVGEFIDWCARARDLGLMEICLPDLLLFRRIHGSNLGIVERTSRSDYAKVIKASLDRRRARGQES